MTDTIEFPFDLLDKEYVIPLVLRPRVMNAALLNFLRHYFMRPEYMVTERFKKKPNTNLVPEQQEILIIHGASWVPTETEKRPAIVIQRLEWRPMPVGMGDSRFFTENNTENTSYIINWRGGHVITCHSRESGELECLVEEIINAFLALGPVLRRALGLARLRISNVGKPSAYVAARDYFICPVTIIYEWSEGWQLTQPIDSVAQDLLKIFEDAGSPPHHI